jgi:hypothetical protein
MGMKLGKNGDKCRFGLRCSTRSWLGKRVRELAGSGGWPGSLGTVVAVEVHPVEYGWFKMLHDDPEIRALCSNESILMHSTEVEIVGVEILKGRKR